VHNPARNVPACYYVPLIRRFDSVAAAETRSRMRAHLGLSTRERIVLVPFSQWAWALSDRVRPGCLRRLAPIYGEYFRSLPGRGPCDRDVPPAVLYRAAAPDRHPPANHRSKSHRLCAAGRSSDVVLCDNAISNTIGLAIHRAIPVVRLYNSVTLRPGGACEVSFPLDPGIRDLIRGSDGADSPPIFPFHVFPIGLFAELGDVLRDNPYDGGAAGQGIARCGRCGRAIERTLWDSPFRAGGPWSTGRVSLVFSRGPAEARARSSPSP